ncbi:MAG: hypothetical protein HRU75_04400 [Planctomycetia bacterium]|nr:MAG: hypothetical protein HRU75_04400 [Planctomycetia bacterium]
MSRKHRDPAVGRRVSGPPAQDSGPGAPRARQALGPGGVLQVLQRRPGWVALTVVLLVVVAARLAFTLLLQLPSVSDVRIDVEARNGRYRQLLTADAAALAGERNAALRIFGELAFDPGGADVRRVTDALATQGGDSMLPRLALAATALVELQRRGTPEVEWWHAIEPYAGGLCGASLAHHQFERFSALAASNLHARADAGSAWQIAEMVVEPSLGPFLQVTAAHLERAAAARRAAGDAAAADTCTRALRCWLRAWVLERGPIGLRLLAADTLLRSLAREVGQAGAASSAARDLAEWVRGRRGDAAARPVAMLDVRRGRAVDADAYTSLVSRAYAALSIGGASAVAALLGLGLFLFSRRAARESFPLRAIPLISAAVSAAVLIVAYWPAPLADMQADLARTWQDARQGAAPAVAPPLRLVTCCLIAGIGLLGAGVGRGGWRQRLGRVGAASGGAAILLLIVTSCAILAAGSAHQRYSRATAAAYESGPVLGVSDPQADRLLRALREWQP